MIPSNHHFLDRSFPPRVLIYRHMEYLKAGTMMEVHSVPCRVTMVLMIWCLAWSQAIPMLKFPESCLLSKDRREEENLKKNNLLFCSKHDFSQPWCVPLTPEMP
jgi:hypothetical protein